jgi:hypothetical protein
MSQLKPQAVSAEIEAEISKVISRCPPLCTLARKPLFFSNVAAQQSFGLCTRISLGKRAGYSSSACWCIRQYVFRDNIYAYNHASLSPLRSVQANALNGKDFHGC